MTTKTVNLSKATPPRRITRALSAVIRTGWIAPALLAASMSAQADCTANLIATVGNQPAMAAVQWNVYRGDTLITSTRQHSSVQTLPCGDYYITATLGNLTRTRNATLIGGTSNMIVIEMGA